jgi:hypothetical protein
MFSFTHGTVGIIDTTDQEVDRVGWKVHARAIFAAMLWQP